MSKLSPLRRETVFNRLVDAPCSVTISCGIVASSLWPNLFSKCSTLTPSSSNLASIIRILSESGISPVSMVFFALSDSCLLNVARDDSQDAVSKPSSALIGDQLVNVSRVRQSRHAFLGVALMLDMEGDRLSGIRFKVNRVGFNRTHAVRLRNLTDAYRTQYSPRIAP